MGLAIAPVEVTTFQLVVLVLASFLAVPKVCDLVEVMSDFGPR